MYTLHIATYDELIARDNVSIVTHTNTYLLGPGMFYYPILPRCECLGTSFTSATLEFPIRTNNIAIEAWMLTIEDQIKHKLI